MKTIKKESSKGVVMDRAKAEEIFNDLYKDINGHNLSLQGRNSNNLTDKSFVYGEVKFKSFCEILKAANVKPGGVFYDLGSGTGKAVFVAHLAFDFDRAIGIELVPPLHEGAASVLESYDKKYRPDEKKDKEIKLVNGSFLDYDFSNADVIFANSTCFPDELMESLLANLATTKSGTIILSLSKAFRDPSIEVLGSKLYEFSWGEATIYSQVKK